MNHSTHRSPHAHDDDDGELDPSHLPVEPEDGTMPGGTGEPDQDGTVDPTV